MVVLRRRSGKYNRPIHSAGEGFSNPLFGKTGPTAWLAPVFPYLLAGIFKTFRTQPGVSDCSPGFGLLFFRVDLHSYLFHC